MAHVHVLSCNVKVLVPVNADLRLSKRVGRRCRSAGFQHSSRGEQSRNPNKKQSLAVRCSSTSVAISEAESGRPKVQTQAWEADLRQKSAMESGLKFKLSDFELYPHVSIGLAGKTDEVLFEGEVRNPDSHLKGMRVVLRQLASRRAQLWGQRALEVLSRIDLREDSRLSYATKVHGYIGAPGDSSSLTLVHGFNGSYSLHQWLHAEDWSTELGTRLFLEEESPRRIGDDRIGGPAVSRQLRLVRILMRDLLIGVNYLHCRGFAHTQLRLQNLQISEADRRVKLGLLGNATALPDRNGIHAVGFEHNLSKASETRKRMIAYDIKCVGFIMAKIVLRELMNPSTFSLFKTLLSQGNDPASLREMYITSVIKGAPADNPGIQLLDRDGGAGWSLLAEMLATKPIDRISCKDALRHQFLCGPLWRVAPTIEMTRWSLGSTTVRIVEEYIHDPQQRMRLTKLINTLEQMNPNQDAEAWAKLFPGQWRLLYHNGRQIGLTTRAGSPRVFINRVLLMVKKSPGSERMLSMEAEIKFTAMAPKDWPHDKSGIKGRLKVSAPGVSVANGERLYPGDAAGEATPGPIQPTSPALKLKQKKQESRSKTQSQSKSRHLMPEESLSPSTLPVVRLFYENELELEMELDHAIPDEGFPARTLNELRRQIPKEIFDVSGLVCGTYIDSRLMVLRGVTGSACHFTRSPSTERAGLLN